VGEGDREYRRTSSCIGEREKEIMQARLGLI